MLLLLAGILWLTMAGANVPSALLSDLLLGLREPLRRLLEGAGAPWWAVGALVDGVYQTTAWVVSVMLPPWPSSFPSSPCWRTWGTCPGWPSTWTTSSTAPGPTAGRPSPCAWAWGATPAASWAAGSSRAPRERLIAILTNALMPCNGRFPTLIALISLFFAAGSGLWRSLGAALLLMSCIVLAVAVTLWSSRLLSATALKGLPSAFSLELPPYRLPRLGQVLVRSVLDRTLFVLGRAVTVAAPAAW